MRHPQLLADALNDRPATVEGIWGRTSGWSFDTITRGLKILVADGLAVRSEHPQYCPDCGTDLDPELRYRAAR